MTAKVNGELHMKGAIVP